MFLRALSNVIHQSIMNQSVRGLVCGNSVYRSLFQFSLNNKTLMDACFIGGLHQVVRSSNLQPDDRSKANSSRGNQSSTQLVYRSPKAKELRRIRLASCSFSLVTASLPPVLYFMPDCTLKLWFTFSLVCLMTFSLNWFTVSHLLLARHPLEVVYSPKTSTYMLTALRQFPFRPEHLTFKQADTFEIKTPGPFATRGVRTGKDSARKFCFFDDGSIDKIQFAKLAGYIDCEGMPHKDHSHSQ